MIGAAEFANVMAHLSTPAGHARNLFELERRERLLIAVLNDPGLRPRCQRCKIPGPPWRHDCDKWLARFPGGCP